MTTRPAHRVDYEEIDPFHWLVRCTECDYKALTTTERDDLDGDHVDFDIECIDHGDRAFRHAAMVPATMPKPRECSL